MKGEIDGQVMTVGQVGTKVKFAYKPSGSSGCHLSPVSMQELGVFLLPLNGMLVHRRVTPV